ncbi:hypothetical protein ERJ75_000874100 [Trypanosoma vivax]|nr:hypothetical protein ERJ75_000874100 [Trypanosoma vivax]
MGPAEVRLRERHFAFRPFLKQADPKKRAPIPTRAPQRQPTRSNAARAWAKGFCGAVRSQRDPESRRVRAEPRQGQLLERQTRNAERRANALRGFLRACLRRLCPATFLDRVPATGSDCTTLLSSCGASLRPFTDKHARAPLGAFRVPLCCRLFASLRFGGAGRSFSLSRKRGHPVLEPSRRKRNAFYFLPPRARGNVAK